MRQVAPNPLIFNSECALLSMQNALKQRLIKVWNNKIISSLYTMHCGTVYTSDIMLMPTPIAPLFM